MHIISDNLYRNSCIVKVRITSIQGNFLSHAFKLFVFPKTCSVLIGSHRISFPYLTTFTARQQKRNVFAMKSPENRAVRNERKTHVTHPRDFIGCKGWECAMDTIPCKKYICERHFSNHGNVWKVKTSWLDRVQDTQKRETANHTQNWGLHSSRAQKCYGKIDLG